MPRRRYSTLASENCLTLYKQTRDVGGEGGVQRKWFDVCRKSRRTVVAAAMLYMGGGEGGLFDRSSGLGLPSSQTRPGVAVG